MLKLHEYFKLDNRVMELYNRVRAELISNNKEEVWNHTVRVIKNLYVVAGKIRFEFKTALIAAICHDIGYNEVIKRHEHASAIMMMKILNKMYDHKLVSEVIHCIESHEYDGPIKPSTPEAVALHEADMMDYCGEQGIINALLIGKNLGLSKLVTCKRITNMISEGFISKELRKDYEKIIDKTRKFYENMIKEIIREKEEMEENGIKRSWLS